MSGIIPNLSAGGLPIGTPTVSQAVVPAAPFTEDCTVLGLPSDCTARVQPSQINAFVSEMMALAAAFDNNGNWHCSDINNMARMFNEWRTNTNFAAGNNLLADILALLNLKNCSNAAILPGTAIATCADLAAAIGGAAEVHLTAGSYDPTTNTLTMTLSDASTVAINVANLLKDIDIISPTAGNIITASNGALLTAAGIVTAICATPAARTALANCLLSTDLGNLLNVGTDPGLKLTAQQIVDGIQADPVALCDLFTGIIDDPNLANRVVFGLDKTVANCVPVQYGIATFLADIQGTSVTQESGKNKILTVGSIALGFRFDTVNFITGVGVGAARLTDAVRTTALGAAAATLNTGTEVTASGFQSAQTNTGNGLTSYGAYSAKTNTGAFVTAIGLYAGNGNTGNDSTLVGVNAGYQNTGIRVTAIGAYAGSFNASSYATLLGYFAGYQALNITDSVGIGRNSIANANGINMVAVGSLSAQYSVGDDVTAIGTSSGYENISIGSTFIGKLSGYRNVGFENTFTGLNSGYQNQGVNSSGFGAYAGGKFLPGLVINGTSVIATKTINAPAHGLTIGGKYSVNINGAPAPLIPVNSAVTLTVTDANNLAITMSSNFVASQALTVVLNTINGFDNATAVGYDAQNTANNEVKLGDLNVVSVRTAGAYFGTAFNVVSDERNKSNIEKIDIDAAIEFSKMVSFKQFTLLQSFAGFEMRNNIENYEYESKSAQLAEELNAAGGSAKKSNGGSKKTAVVIATDADEPLVPPVPVQDVLRLRGVDEIKSDIKKLKKPDTRERAAISQSAGIIAQDIQKITSKLGKFEWLVIESSQGELTVDYIAMLVIMQAAFNERLNRAGF